MSKPVRLELSSRLGWVRLDQMKINPQAQRGFNANNPAVKNPFNPDVMGFLHVSHRDGWYYVVDGQHRMRGACAFLGDTSQQIQCHIYEGLTSQEEAKLFLMLNDTKHQTPMDKHKKGVHANLADDCDVERICRSLDLRIGLDKSCEEIACITALMKVYRKHGPAALSFSMRVIRDAYGYDGFKQHMIEALALITDRYGTGIDEKSLIERLDKKGMIELNRSAKAMKEATGNPLSQCYAHSMIQFYNWRNGSPVSPWWNLSVVGVA